MLSRLEFRNLFVNSLSHLYDENEIYAMFRAYVSDRLGMEPYRYFLDMNSPIADEDLAHSDIQRLSKGEPLQYVVGKASFCGMELMVSPDVLIPRPETEELVQHIVSDWEKADSLSILDIGTGSGAIAIALARLLPHATVCAVDFSEKALQMAEKNARHHQTQVLFSQLDVLSENLPSQYDVIVSNPPYIPRSKREELHRNVVDFEPGAALFVPDEQPTIFYDRIIRLSQTALNPSGGLYFETYESYQDEIVEGMKTAGFIHVQAFADQFGRPRFVTGGQRA